MLKNRFQSRKLSVFSSCQLNTSVILLSGCKRKRLVEYIVITAYGVTLYVPVLLLVFMNDRVILIDELFDFFLLARDKMESFWLKNITRGGGVVLLDEEDWLYLRFQFS